MVCLVRLMLYAVRHSSIGKNLTTASTILCLLNYGILCSVRTYQIQFETENYDETVASTRGIFDDEIALKFTFCIVIDRCRNIFHRDYL